MSGISMTMWLALGGALGAITRYGLGETARRWSRLPGWGAILLANVAGCALMALGVLWVSSLAEAAAAGNAEPATVEALRAVLLLGYCGALTTFSAFALDTAILWHEGRPKIALFNVIASVALGIGVIECVLRFAGGAG